MSKPLTLKLKTISIKARELQSSYKKTNILQFSVEIAKQLQNMQISFSENQVIDQKKFNEQIKLSPVQY